jgi:hypothetical protein
MRASDAERALAEVGDALREPPGRQKPAAEPVKGERDHGGGEVEAGAGGVEHAGGVSHAGGSWEREEADTSMRCQCLT